MKVDKRGYVYLGSDFAGDEFELIVEADGNILRLEKIVKIPARNAWFYDEDWQEGEKVAQDQIDRGKTKKISDVKSYLSKIRGKKHKE